MKKKKILLSKRDISIVILTTILLLAAIALTALNLTSHKIFWHSLREIGNSVYLYFTSMISGERPNPDAVVFNQFDPETLPVIISHNQTQSGLRTKAFFQLLVNGGNISHAWMDFTYTLRLILLIVAIPLVMVIIGGYWFFEHWLVRNTDLEYTEDSRGLRLFLKIKEKILDKCFRYIRDTFNFIRYTKLSKILVIILVIYNLNIASFVLSALAFYFYFVCSFDFVAIWNLFVRFVSDIRILFMPIFIPVWIFLVIFFIIRAKKKAGYIKLQQMFEKNEEFANQLGVATGIYGAPGVGKNLLEVSLAIHCEKLLREQSYETLMEIRAEFPDFAWRNFEKLVEEISNQDGIVNRIQVKNVIEKALLSDKKQFKFLHMNHKADYCNRLAVLSFEEELLNYAQLYYIFLSTLAISSYSIRFNIGLCGDDIHTPFLNYNFFNNDMRDIEDISVRAKILDYNKIRLYKQKGEPGNSKPVSLVSEGVITISEMGKERGNAYTRRNGNFDKEKDDVTPSNDGTAQFIGMIRHLTTIRNQQYGKMLWDDQKMSSINGYEAGMAETNIHIPGQKKDKRIAIPLFAFEEIALEWATSHFEHRYRKYIQNRNERTLYFYFISHMRLLLLKINNSIYNVFGYHRLTLNLSNTDVNGSQIKNKDHQFYILYNIVFASRYATDCYSKGFEGVFNTAVSGINNTASYAGLVATSSELKEQHGYFSDNISKAAQNYQLKNTDFKKQKKSDKK